MVRETYFPSATGLGDIYVRTWAGDAPQRGVLQLTHGMAEHILRYEDFAAYLNGNGFAVVGQDMAGHGQSVGEGGIKGYFGPERGWDRLVEDMRQVYRLTKEAYPDIPYILMGHSMGSFLARTYAARYGSDMDAFIFSGTAGKNGALPIAKWLAKREMKKRGNAPSDLLNKLAFGAYAKAVPAARTGFDWLSRDAQIVDAYNADPNCGFTFTAAGFRDLFDGLQEIGDKGWAERVPKKPILLIAGEKDPVGGKNAAGVKEVEAALRATGHDVTCHIYPECRHEVLNELNRQDVYRDVLAFLEGVL